MSKTKIGPIASMSAIKTAIANNEADKLKQLLEGQQLDGLQKDYLLELAKMSNKEISEIVSSTPAKP
ncbi:hypothetical protein [Glaciecola sp. 1036]|uniref:hypothetical protein n=1 Tax=Alteromonadaceae TaxID=72275 RepID=UPI003D04B0AF